MNQNDLFNVFNSELNGFIKLKPINLIKNIFEKHSQKYHEFKSHIIENAKEEYRKTLNILIESTNEKEFVLRKINFEINERSYENEKLLTLNFFRMSNCFKQCFGHPNLKVNQILSLDNDVVFVFISNYDVKITHVLRFNPKMIDRENYELCKDIEDIDVKVANGSTSSRYIMFLNQNKKAIQGSLRCNKYFDSGFSLNVFAKIDKIISSYFMTKSRKLFVIDENGKLYRKDLVHEDGDMYLVKNPKTDSIVDKEISFLMPTDGSKFLEIDVSSDENIIFLRTETNLECYDNNIITLI